MLRQTTPDPDRPDALPPELPAASEGDAPADVPAAASRAEAGHSDGGDASVAVSITVAGGLDAVIRGPTDTDLLVAGWTQDSLDLASRVSYILRAVPAETEAVDLGFEDVPVWLRPRRGRPGAPLQPEAGVGAAIVRLARFWTWTAWQRGDFAGTAPPDLAAAVGWDRWPQLQDGADDPQGLPERRAWSFFCAVRDDLIQRRWSPNSPAWYNAGLDHTYGLRRRSQQQQQQQQRSAASTLPNSTSSEGAGDDPEPGYRLTSDLYNLDGSVADPGSRPLHACYIQTVADNLDGPGGILDLAAREAAVFRFGGGSGSNFAALRGRGEPLSGGGTSSGMLSFVAGLDALAGAIKSGGTTRRAAKMIVVDGDHPDVFDFCGIKLEGEHVAKSLALGSAVLASLGSGTPFPLAWAAPNSAYRYAPGQNGNNSVRLDGTAFWAAVDADAAWPRRRRTGGTDTSRTARELLDAIVEGAWGCGDPGVQWDDLIQAGHTCPANGRINASNPCSEYLFLDDTACNLASVNLAHHDFDGAGTRADRQRRAEARLFATAVRAAWILDLVVSASAYPTARIAERTRRTRTIGLGPMDLAGRLIREGLAYDSDEGRAYATYAMGVLGAGAWCASASLAAIFGPAPAFLEPKNAQALARVMTRQIAWDVVQRHFQTPQIAHADRWGAVVQVWGPATLLRNAQLTVCAPTGTIALVAGCDGTGIEPLWQVEGYDKACADNRTLRIEPRCVSFARARYDGAPPPGVLVSAHELSPEAHLRMVAAIQPRVSGGVSKTVNLPESATRGDIAAVLRLSHELGVKCLSVYRDGSKASQPLGAATPDAYVADQLERYVDSFRPSAPAVAPGSVPAVAPGSAPAAAPRDRRWGRHAATQWNLRVGTRALYLTVTGSPPVQIRVDAPAEPAGPVEDAAIRLAARLSSRLLQAGVSLDEVAEMWEACGADGVSGGPVVPADGPVRFAPSIFVAAGRLMRQAGLHEQGGGTASPGGEVASLGATRRDGAGSVAAPGVLTRVLDGLVCPSCGGPQRQTGTCRTCSACGASSGGCA